MSEFSKSPPVLGEFALPNCTLDRRFFRTEAITCSESAKPWPVMLGVEKPCSNSRVRR